MTFGHPTVGVLLLFREAIRLTYNLQPVCGLDRFSGSWVDRPLDIGVLVLMNHGPEIEMISPPCLFSTTFSALLA